MTFTKLTEAEAIAAGRDLRDAELDPTDLDAIVLAAGGDGVVSGCAVTAAGENSVTIGAGVVRIGGQNYAVTGDEVTLDAADATYRRYDLIQVGTDGNPTEVAGTAESFAVYPDVTAAHVALFIAPRPIGDDTVATGDLLDMRVPVRIGGDLTEDLYLDGQSIFGDRATAATAIPIGSPLQMFAGGETVTNAARIAGVFGKLLAADTITVDVANGAFTGIDAAATIVWEQNPYILGMGTLFANKLIHRNPPGEARTWSQMIGNQDNPTWHVDTQTGQTHPLILSFLSFPTLTRSNSGTGTAQQITNHKARGANVGAGMTVTQVVGFHAVGSIGAGTIVDQVGAALPALSSGTKNVGLLLGATIAGAYDAITNIPTGTWSLYNADPADVFLGAGEIFIGTAAGASITTGTDAPTAAATDGSIYLRTGGGGAALYIRENGAWVTVGAAT